MAKFIVIAVSGTPGTGKTTHSKRISAHFGFEYLDVTKYIAEHSLSEGFDYQKDCEIVDEQLLVSNILEFVKSLKNQRKKGVVIDSHMAHYLPSDAVDLCIITKVSLKILKKRLELRGYLVEKVRENLDSEIFDVCYVESLENNHNVFVLSKTNTSLVYPIIFGL